MIMVLENIKTFFTKIITNTSSFENNPYQQVILAHMANVLGCHTFWDLKYIFRVAL